MPINDSIGMEKLEKQMQLLSFSIGLNINRIERDISNISDRQLQFY